MDDDARASDFIEVSLFNVCFPDALGLRPPQTPNGRDWKSAVAEKRRAPMPADSGKRNHEDDAKRAPVRSRNGSPLNGAFTPRH